MPSGAGANEVESRAVCARELARRGDEHACTDAGDRSRELGLELGEVVGRERRGDDVVRSLEELVGDLDLLRAVAKTGERIDEPLQPVLGVHDLVRVGAVQDVRLVVDDERLLVLAPEDVQPAVQEHAIVLERKRTLGACA